MIMEWLPIPVLFLLGAALALTVNFPHMPDQKARLAAHADNVLNVSGMVFAAAVFTGVLQGTGMVDHMAGLAGRTSSPTAWARTWPSSPAS